jgi:hypothetical protein
LSDVQVLIGVGSLLALLAVAVGLAVMLIVSFEDATTDVPISLRSCAQKRKRWIASVSA